MVKMMTDFRKEYEEPVLVGEGGQGKVYRLKKRSGESYAALKILTDRDRWQNEVYILKNADHDLFPKFYESGEENGEYYILMEYIWGEDMASVLTRRKGMVQPEAMRMALTIADGLGWIQTKSRPVVFRDLKAENIIITPDGNVRLVDMGSACFVDEAGESITGTEGASAPEQMEGNATLASDVYAFGRLFHFMLTGINPAENPKATLLPITSFDENLSLSLELLIEDCTGVVPEERIPDMYSVTQRMVEIATQTPGGYRKMEKMAAKEIARRTEGLDVKYTKNIRE